MSDPTATIEPVQVICIKWGSVYDSEDVNKLRSMVLRNTGLPVDFHLFTNDEMPGLDPEILVHPEPGLNIPKEQDRWSYRKEAALCADDLGGLTGKRVFFFDLDMVVVGNLDELFEYPEGDKFYIINDWNTRGNHVGQASCYSFVVGTLGFVKEEYEKDPLGYQKRFGTASQEYLSSKVIGRDGKLNFWPDEWFRSFRFHCLPHPLLRWFTTPHMPPKETKMIAFHGLPDIRGAIAGRWGSEHDIKRAKGWKRLYKHCKPTPWVLDYWR